MSEPCAKIVADSISPDGIRLTTMQATGHRFILSEFNTHRRFSRNSASSRAIPLSKQIAKVREDLAMPLVFPAEQRGMQGGEPLDEQATAQAQDNWDKASKNAIEAAEAMGMLGVHKSVANRLLEPFMWHTIVVTSTAWENFFAQRCSPLAQPEIRVLAEAMRDAMEVSTPRLMHQGDWHSPYIDDQTSIDIASMVGLEAPIGTEGEDLKNWRMTGDVDDLVRQSWEIETKVSAARCARVSYLTQEGTRDIQADLTLYDRLTTARPAHWSPLEHVATPWAWNRQEGCIHFGQDPEADHDTFTCISTENLPRVGNLLGWRSLRTTVEAEQGQVTWL